MKVRGTLQPSRTGRGAFYGQRHLREGRKSPAIFEDILYLQAISTLSQLALPASLLPQGGAMGVQ
jgi:hypothetical protein